MADNTNNPTPVTIHVGGEADESTAGTDGIDVVDFAGGDDYGGAGGRHFNIILGGSGGDKLWSWGIYDDVFGGSGNDTITLAGHGGWAFGGTGDDTIIGSDNPYLVERLDGGAGNDTIDGGGGSDIIIGGAGDDDLTGGSGADLFVFSEGHGTDTIQDFNAAEGDRIYLRGFDQTITWDQLSSKVTTVTDDNNVVTGVQIDLSEWGGGTIILNGVTNVSDVTSNMFYLDLLVGDGGDNAISGGADDDTMTGGAGADTFYFSEGHGSDTITDFDTSNDRIDLSGFNVAITWDALQAAMSQIEDDANTPGVDETATVIDLSAWGGGTITLQGVTATDLTANMFALPDGSGANGAYYYGSDGADIIEGSVGNDIIYGMEGGDTLKGGLGHDWLFGQEGDDTLEGGEGSDVLMGGEGDDTLSGGAGDDLMIGGAGNDTMTGGTGADTFVFYDGHGNDTITDFDGANDKINLTALYHALTWEQLSATFSTVTDEDNNVTGVLIDLTAYGGGTITLEGVTDTSSLTEDMFELYTLTGGEGDDSIQGGTSDDTLTGNAGADTFVFAHNNGDDTVTDFTDGEDLIDLSAFTGITGFSDLAVTQDNNNVVIDLSAHNGGTITLENVNLADLDAADFTFYEAPAETDGL